MKYWWLYASIIIVCLLDQTTKMLWGDNVFIPLLPGIVSISSTGNKGIAFSIPLEGILLIVVTIAVIVWGIYFIYRYINIDSLLAQILCGVIVGGAFGNLYDRIFFGYVRDFIRIWIWPVFNVADMFISIGGILFIIWYGKIRLPSKEKKA